MWRSALTLDIPLARKVLEHLRAHPEEHDQDLYGVKTSCGTQACIAGTAVLMDPATTVSWRDGGMNTMVTVNGQRVDVADRAAQLLGLHRFDAADLFYTWNNNDALNELQSYIKTAEAVQAAVGVT